jgi:hypothetical protein
VTQRILVTWQQATEILRTGDILLCRAHTLEGQVIKHVTDSQYCHMAMAGQSYGPHGKKRSLRHCETVGHRDAQEIDLQGEIRNFPGLYDAFRVDRKQFPNFDPERAWKFMQAAAGSGYGWSNIWRVWMRRRLNPLLRLIDCPILPIPNNDDPTVPRDCSVLGQAAIRFAGGPRWATFDCDVVPGMMADRYTSYLCTLYYDKLPSSEISKDGPAAAKVARLAARGN